MHTLQETQTAVSGASNAGSHAVLCRFCNQPVTQTFVDLGMSPLCESYISAEQLNRQESFYPLYVRVCQHCFLVQLEQYVSEKDIFTDYAYFSSYSDSWVEHARRYTEKMIADFGLTARSHVVEIASNDGYLLQHFVRRSIPSLGIEPAANVAAVAIKNGVPTHVDFFGVALARKLASEGKQADLLLGNNVLAQVPDLNDFVAGMRILLKPNGVITMEFPHLLRLVAENQFDTIYHEHFSYFSLYTTQKIFAAHGLEVFHMEELSTHGGSLRVYAKHAADDSKKMSSQMRELLARELHAGIATIDYYRAFAEQVKETKRKILRFLIEKKREGKSIVGYGAPGKGNTLLNYCGIRTDFLDYTVDRSPHKQGKFLPGTHIPIHAPEQIRKTRPDYLFILPWNIKDEIMSQMQYVRDWGCRFVVPIPEVKIYE